MTHPLSRLLDARLAEDPASPLITFYDDATGERIELSAATFANWTAKTCGLLASKGVRDGEGVGLWLPVHWQSAAIITACWRLGARPLMNEAAPVIVAHAPRIDEALDEADEVLGLALAPMAGRLSEVPLGAEDFAIEVPGFADSWTGPHPAEVIVEPLADLAGKRILTTASEWDDHSIAALLVTPIATGGSLVLVRNADPDAIARKVETERVDVVL